MNHFKRDNLTSGLEIANKVTEIIKKKEVKWFDLVVDKNNANYINHS